MKEKLQKILKLARKQMFFIICGVVAIAGAAFCFWPTQGWFASLADDVSKSADQAQQISSLETKPRHLPQMSLASADPQVLQNFPTESAIDQGKKAVKELGDLSVAMLKSAVEINEHTPLVPGALPAGNVIDRTTFGQQYVTAATDEFRIMHWPTKDVVAARPGRAIPALNAVRPVEQADIDQAKKDLADRINRDNLPANATTDQIAAVAAKIKAAEPQVPLELEAQRSKQGKVYIDHGAMKTPGTVFAAFQAAQNALTPDLIWQAQLGLWIDEDVATGVAFANADAKDVNDSPIKRIIDVSMNNPPYIVSGDPASLPGEDGAIMPVMDVSPTGRVSNGMYDVVHFQVTMDVDATKMPQALAGLTGDQLITVLNINSATPLDEAQVATQTTGPCLYGTAPIVRLVVACEEVLLHTKQGWMNNYEPPNSKPTAASGGAAQGETIFPILVRSAGQ